MRGVDQDIHEDNLEQVGIRGDRRRGAIHLHLHVEERRVPTQGVTPVLAYPPRWRPR
jgi:hypothetical protein